MYGRPPTGSLANRPSSRAGAPSTSNNNTWGARTSISTQGSNAPPPRTGTASRGARPSTQSRQMSVIDRPTTQAGLGGFRPKTQGLGRMVQDATYFQSELRNKVGLLSEELYRMNAEVDSIQKENSNYAVFEKRAEGLSEELKELQGQLGDYNTLVDKLHTDTDLEEIEKEFGGLQAKNLRDGATLDEIFLQRQQRESAVKEIERQIGEEQRQAEEHITDLDDEKRGEYFRMKEENATVLIKVSELQKELASINIKFEKIHGDLGKDSTKQRAISLLQKLSEVRDRKSELETAINNSEKESGPQEKNRLMEQVKNDSFETSGMERRVAELEMSIRQMKDQLAQLDSQLDPNQSEKNAKYEELVKRDKEMQAFLDTFDKKRDEAVSKNEGVEATIVSLLESIKTLSGRDLANMPNAEGYNELQGDLAFKEKEMKNSEKTMDALLQERERRTQDLEKVSQLESKLNAELDHLKSRIGNLQQDIIKVSDVQGVKQKAEREHAINQDVHAALQAQREGLKTLVSSAASRYETKKSQLLENETHNQLGALEQRLRHHEGITFSIKDYIASKTAESDYRPLAAEVVSLMDDLNGQLVKMLSQLPAR